MKKKLNITMDPELIEQARRQARVANKSLSELIAQSLRLIINKNGTSGIDPLKAFHRKYLKKGFVEPSDAKLAEIRKGLLGKHS